MPGVSHRPLAIGVLEVVAKHHWVPALGPGAQDEVDNVPQKMWVGTSDAPMVALWPDRRQSSPRRSFSSPCSSTWQMARSAYVCSWSLGLADFLAT